MNSPQANRKRRTSAGSGRGSASVDLQSAYLYAAANPYGLDDAQRFWANSNVRLGLASDAGLAPSKRTRGMLEAPCSVCGAMVQVEKMPKNRYEVRCDRCKQDLMNLLTPEERRYLEASEQARVNQTRFDGLPKMTQEDLDAIAEMQAKQNLGNGQNDMARSKNPPQNKRETISVEEPQYDDDDWGFITDEVVDCED